MGQFGTKIKSLSCMLFPQNVPVINKTSIKELTRKDNKMAYHNILLCL